MQNHAQQIVFSPQSTEKTIIFNFTRNFFINSNIAFSVPLNND